MTECLKVTRDRDVAVITLDNPPVNALSPGLLEDIQKATNAAANDPQVRAVVIIGGGRVFSAGVDLQRFVRAAPGERSLGNLLLSLLAIEDCSKPVVMAIHGVAFGGGLELAMAGHYRVIAPSAHLGQPEVKVGLIPGAGGTQRLPRLAGVAKALEMCAFGEPITAQEALALGMVDRLIEGDLLHGAVEYAREVAGKHLPKTRERSIAPGEKEPALFVSAREQARKTKRGQTAPLAAIDAVEASARLSFEEGCRREAAAFPRVPQLDAIPGAGPRFLRRARSVQDPGRSGGDGDSRDRVRGHHRRGDDGWRHRHVLRQRGHPGHCQRGEPGGAGSRDGCHPQQLRGFREERALFAGGDGP